MPLKAVFGRSILLIAFYIYFPRINNIARRIGFAL